MNSALFRPLPALVIFILLVAACVAHGQDYLYRIGSPTFTTQEAVDLGFINLGNGNLHLEIEMGSFPQRGKIEFAPRLFYDSRIWKIVNGAWQPSNVANSWAGWRYGTTADRGVVTYDETATSCGTGLYIRNYSNFTWTSPDGTKRVFPVQTSRNECTGGGTSSGNAMVDDSSGYKINISNYTEAEVRDRQGRKVYQVFAERYLDANGNFVQTSSTTGERTDTLGRTPVVRSSSGNQFFYDVLNSQGTRSRWTVTTSNLSVSTAFGQAGISEFSGTITVVQSVTLPDGSAYSFTYDSLYGDLTSVTLRTGGTATFDYLVFSDAYGKKNRWIDSRTSGGGSWNYTPVVLTTCSPTQVGCSQKITVTKPGGDESVFTFVLNAGAWNTENRTYTGSSSGGTLLEIVATDFDFTNACPTLGCLGAGYVRPTRLTTTRPSANGTLSKKVEFIYDTPQRGNVTFNKQWGYTLTSFASNPDRQTETAYLTASSYTGVNLISCPTSVIMRNSAGTQVSRTDFTYDGGTLTLVSGSSQHSDSTWGTAYTTRCNVTTLSKWVTGTTYRNTTFTYDTTGQILTETNPRGYYKTYSYADAYYRDNGSNPGTAYTPATFTNAFLTELTLSNLVGSNKLYYTYYYDSGKVASDGDTNLSKIYFHYLDSLDRQTHRYERSLANGSRGWTLTQYLSSTESATYVGITSTTPSASCTSCTQERSYLDAWARPIQSKLASDPQGATFTDTGYDARGRVSTVSNPYRSTSDSTYGTTTNLYDGLDRITQVTKPDGNYTRRIEGTLVGPAGGRTSQLCGGSIGYPTLKIDEAGKKLQIWTDAFAQTVETDEPDASNNLTIGTCYQYDALDSLVQVTQGSQTRTYVYDGLSRKTSESLPETGTTTYFYTHTGGSPCSGVETDFCRVTDARGITTTYTYSSRDILTGMTYSDATPAVTYSYGDSTYNGLTITYGGGRRTGMSDGAGQTAWSYDPFGNIVIERRTVGGVTKTTSFTYHLDGSIATKTYASGRTISYTYSNAGRVTSVVDTANNINYATGASYAPQGELASIVQGQVTGGFAGITFTKTYNNRLQLSAQQATSTAGTILNLSYSYSTGGINNGNVLQITNNLDNDRTQSFEYDSLNRLTVAKTPVRVSPPTRLWGNSYTYDRYGNLLQKTVLSDAAMGESLSVAVNASTNRIVGNTYDAAGNLTNDGLNTHDFDALNRMNSCTGQSRTFDGDNWRVQKASGELSWFEPSDTHQLMAETDTSGNTIAEYVFMGDLMIGKRLASGTINFFFNDRLQSARVMASSTGITQQESDYYPFGGERIITALAENRFKFTSKKRDVETGLDYSQNRMLSSSLGRWNSADPVDGDPAEPQSLNKYSYVANNPTNYKDRSGTLREFADRTKNDAIGSGGCPGHPGRVRAVIDFPTIGFATTNYRFETMERGLCRYVLYCPNNSKVSCPADNPVYVSPFVTRCLRYLYDIRLKATFSGRVSCFPVGLAKMSATPVNCT
jgi:RHS repeat-associated protein